MTTPAGDNPQPDPAGQFRAVPPGMEGMFILPPEPTVEGEEIPPVPVTFATGLTPKDALGHRWALLRAFDGTMTIDFRLPWQMAAQIGAGIAQGLANMQRQAQAEEGPKLVLPLQSAGGLFLPRPGEPRPPLNGAGH